jgi:hypothetical protein
VDPASQIGDMADDPHAAVAFAQGVEDVEDLVEGLVVEAAEALVDEERVATLGPQGAPVPDQAKRGKKSPSE